MLCSSVSDNKLPTESLKAPQFVQNATFYVTIPLKGAFKEKLQNQNLNHLSFFFFIVPVSVRESPPRKVFNLKQ